MTVSINEITVSDRTAGPCAVATGPDGAPWFTRPALAEKRAGQRGESGDRSPCKVTDPRIHPSLSGRLVVNFAEWAPSATEPAVTPARPSRPAGTGRPGGRR